MKINRICGAETVGEELADLSEVGAVEEARVARQSSIEDSDISLGETGGGARGARVLYWMPVISMVLACLVAYRFMLFELKTGGIFVSVPSTVLFMLFAYVGLIKPEMSFTLQFYLPICVTILLGPIFLSSLRDAITLRSDTLSFGTASDNVGAGIDGPDLSNKDLRSLTSFGSSLPKANLSGANLTGASFFETDLRWAQFTFSQVAGTKFSHCDLRSTKWTLDSRTESPKSFMASDLSRSNLRGIEFYKTSFNGACMSEVDLSVAKLIGVDLDRTVLVGANLKFARLDSSSAKDADFLDADLEGAVLLECDIRGAKLDKAKNLTQSQVDLAFGDASTTLPESVKRPLWWLLRVQRPKPATEATSCIAR